MDVFHHHGKTPKKFARACFHVLWGAFRACQGLRSVGSCPLPCGWLCGHPWVALAPIPVMSQPWAVSTGGIHELLLEQHPGPIAGRSLSRMLKELVLHHRKSLANRFG